MKINFILNRKKNFLRLRYLLLVSAKEIVPQN